MGQELDEKRWVTETVNEAQGFRTCLSAPLGVTTVDSTQDLAMFENPAFGLVMVLDGAIQVTSRDEFIYHEMMAHVPMFAHGAARQVLIIGGGDGGIAREVLRHSTVEALTLVEIDSAVVDLALSHFAEISAGAFDDPRLNLTIADGAHFVRDTGAKFDVIIVDSPDPVGAGAVLFGVPFYRDCAQALAPGGVLVTQSGMPFLTPDWFAAHVRDQREALGATRYFLSTVPSYTGGPMAHGFACGNENVFLLDETQLGARYAEAGSFPLSYWSPSVHRAAFALPPYIQRLAPSDAAARL
ncbi:MAG: polyamine aminopropyltransferase [Pseudomonadota bacterium]